MHVAASRPGARNAAYGTPPTAPPVPAPPAVAESTNEPSPKPIAPRNRIGEKKVMNIVPRQLRR